MQVTHQTLKITSCVQLKSGPKQLNQNSYRAKKLLWNNKQMKQLWNWYLRNVTQPPTKSNPNLSMKVANLHSQVHILIYSDGHMHININKNTQIWIHVTNYGKKKQKQMYTVKITYTCINGKTEVLTFSLSLSSWSLCSFAWPGDLELFWLLFPSWLFRLFEFVTEITIKAVEF